MKRHIYILILGMLCILILTGCQCRHDWLDANCTDAEACSLCGVRQGSPLGHTWRVADCVTPKTCETCGATEGAAAGHSWVEVSCAAPKTCHICGATEGAALPHTWVEADCENSKTCSVCSTIEGTPLGHIWNAATCEEPQTCQVCEKTDGEALGHSWTDATCTTPKTCSTCKTEEGKALGHKWEDATTEVPQTCSVCKATQGTAIKTDPRFKTSACKSLFGTWKSSAPVTARDLGLTDREGSFNKITVFKFHNDGTLTISYEIGNVKACRTLMEAAMVKRTYESYAADGSSKEETDLFFQQYLGLTVQEYAANYAETYIDQLLNQTSSNVYYVAQNKLYGAEHWYDKMEPMVYSIKGSKLVLTDDSGETVEFTRA